MRTAHTARTVCGPHCVCAVRPRSRRQAWSAVGEAILNAAASPLRRLDRAERELLVRLLHGALGAYRRELLA